MVDLRLITEIGVLCAVVVFAWWRYRRCSSRSALLDRYRQTFDAVNDAIFVHDGGNGRIIETNLRAQEMYGYTQEEFRALDVSALSVRDEAFSLHAAHQKISMALSDRPQTFEWYARRKDGYQFWVEVSLRATVIGGKHYVIAAVRDISTWKDAQQSLRDSKEQYCSLFTSMLDGYALHELITDENGVGIDYRYLDVNDAFLAITGLAREALIGKRVCEVMPRTERYWIDAFSAVVKTGVPAHLENYSVELDRYYEVAAFRPSPGHFAVIARDVTHRKKAEDKIKASLSEKETLIRELYHRTKNNMQVISSMLELQAMNTKDARIVSIVRETQNRIMTMALVHQKLYRSQNLSKLDLADYIHELVDMLIASQHISCEKIKVIYDMKPLSVVLDVAMPIGLVINELFTNICKHAFPGDRCGVVRVTLGDNADGSANLAVFDDGVGLPNAFDCRKTATLGVQTVVTLVEHQLHGSVRYESVKGTMCDIIFRHDLYTERV
jgi:PAS domain S-box-containing protein